MSHPIFPSLVLSRGRQCHGPCAVPRDYFQAPEDISLGIGDGLPLLLAGPTAAADFSAEIPAADFSSMAYVQCMQLYRRRSGFQRCKKRANPCRTGHVSEKAAPSGVVSSVRTFANASVLSLIAPSSLCLSAPSHPSATAAGSRFGPFHISDLCQKFDGHTID